MITFRLVIFHFLEEFFSLIRHVCEVHPRIYGTELPVPVCVRPLNQGPASCELPGCEPHWSGITHAQWTASP